MTEAESILNKYVKGQLDRDYSSVDKEQYHVKIATALKAIDDALASKPGASRAVVKIEKAGGNWSPVLKIGNQGFRLAPCEDLQSARWMAEQLQKALS